MVTIALMAYVWTIKSSMDSLTRAREDEGRDLRRVVAEADVRQASLHSRVGALEVRPEAPAIEQYRKVLGEIEDLGHTVRTLDLRVEEAVESMRRTQNKIAARSKRAEAAADTAESPNPNQVEIFPPISVNGHRQRVPFRDPINARGGNT